MGENRIGMDLWMDEVERIAAELEDQGMDAEEAYDLACERGQSAVSERLAEIADNARDRAKYEGM